jgi:hypothetical protein
VRYHNIDHAGKVHTRGILFDAAQELSKNCVTPESRYIYVHRYIKLVHIVLGSFNDTLPFALVT